MLDATLTRIHVPGPVSRPDLLTFVRALRSVSRVPGYHDSQVFRGIDATDTVLVLTEWASAAAARSGRALLAGRRNGAARGGADEVVALVPTFERRLVAEHPAASLLRVTVGRPLDGSRAAGLDRELALRALAAPGSIRTAGGSSARSSVSACRIDFDAEDALWAFLDSPLRHEWSGLARELDQGEWWSLNLPRFGGAARIRPAQGSSLPAPAKRESVASEPLVTRAELDGPLSVELRVHSPSDAEVLLRGRLGERGALRVRAVLESLARDGCRSLHLDIQELEAATPDGLRLLVMAARGLRAAGGTLHLRERESRFRLAARPVSLAQTLAAPRRMREIWPAED